MVVFKFSLVWMMVLAGFVSMAQAEISPLPYHIDTTLPPDDKTEDADKGTPTTNLEVGAEFFGHYNTQANEGMGGLAAIMIDLDVKLNERFSLFGAFHFDSSPWHDFLNETLEQRQHTPLAYDIKLEVEEFFADWIIIPERLKIRAGRRFSRYSYANQLHLADFEFNMKPRIYTSYWGNNHGMAIDGLSLKVKGSSGIANAALFMEAAKNGVASEQTLFTTVLDTHFDFRYFDLGVRGFTYFDHQNETHPLFIYLDETQTSLIPLNDQLGLNAWGGSTQWFFDLSDKKSLLLQAEWINRRMGDDFYPGMYAFVQLVHSERFLTSVMYQQLDIPVIKNNQITSQTEQVYTFGISYFPIEWHRLRLEYSHFSNSLHHRNMILLKYTFIVAV